MKKSEIFKAAQIAVLNADMLISTKKDVLEVLLWEEEFAKLVEEKESQAE